MNVGNSSDYIVNENYVITYPNDSYSEIQNCLIPIIYKISGALSLAGSLAIIFHILRRQYKQTSFYKRRRQKKRLSQISRRSSIDTTRTNNDNNNRRSNVQKRLLLGLSLCDTIQSACHVLSTWPIPKDQDQYNFIRFNIGTQTSCTVQGFGLLFGGLSVPLYNAMLCFYYYLICVKFSPLKKKNNRNNSWGAAGKSGDTQIATNIEPWMHLISILIPLIICIYALVKEMYNPLASGCFLSSYPRKCNLYENVECLRGETAPRFRMICILSIVSASFIIMVISLKLLYKEVKEQENRMVRYSFEMSTNNTLDQNNNITDDEDVFLDDRGFGVSMIDQETTTPVELLEEQSHPTSAKDFIPQIEICIEDDDVILEGCDDNYNNEEKEQEEDYIDEMMEIDFSQRKVHTNNFNRLTEKKEESLFFSTTQTTESITNIAPPATATKTTTTTNNNKTKQPRRNSFSSMFSIANNHNYTTQTPTASRTTNTRVKKTTKRICRRAFMYVIPFIIVWLPTYIQIIWAYCTKEKKDVGMAFFLNVLIGICAPLQGLFNALVYFDNRINYSCWCCSSSNKQNEQKHEKGNRTRTSKV